MEATICLVDTFVDLAPMRVESFRESVRLDHSPYDMAYFVLARRMGATLATLDKALAGLCSQEGVDVLCVQGL